MTLVKVCGMRSLPEARVALEAGANLLGFIFWKPGKRYITPPDAARIISALRAESRDWSAVGVFVDPLPADVSEVAALCDLDYVQLSGEEPADVIAAMPRPTFKALHVKAGHEATAAEIVAADSFGAHRYLLDTHSEALPGGTGRAFDWEASDRGRRLDHIWVSPALKGAVRSHSIIKKTRGWQRASDHVPVIAEIEL